MKDFVFIKPALDSRELAILEDLRHVRDELTILKLDRSTYIKSPDITSLFDKTIKQLQLLYDPRRTNQKGSNEVDRVLECCFQLLSLFFMTIGRNNEAPAAYALTSIIKRFLDHSIEEELFSNKDLAHISATLDKLIGLVKKSHGSYPQRFITLLSSQIDLCLNSLNDLQSRLNWINENLKPVHEKLISISNLISSANSKKNFSSLEILKLQNQLQKIDRQRVAGNFVAVNGKVLEGSNEVGRLLDDCLDWSALALERKGAIPENFKSTYETLIEMRDRLARSMLTHAWSLRKADLYDYQRELDIIDNSRIDGIFHDKNGNLAEPYVQRMFLHLIRKSYSYIYYLMVASVPVSEGLLPVYNQLQTLKGCLIRIKNLGGISCTRELYPYNMKLHSIESMRIDGKFRVEDVVPDGHASVICLLEQCHELSGELRRKVEYNKEKNYPTGFSI